MIPCELPVEAASKGVWDRLVNSVAARGTPKGGPRPRLDKGFFKDDEGDLCVVNDDASLAAALSCGSVLILASASFTLQPATSVFRDSYDTEHIPPAVEPRLAGGIVASALTELAIAGSHACHRPISLRSDQAGFGLLAIKAAVETAFSAELGEASRRLTAGSCLTARFFAKYGPCGSAAASAHAPVPVESDSEARRFAAAAARDDASLVVTVRASGDREDASLEAVPHSRGWSTATLHDVDVTSTIAHDAQRTGGSASAPKPASGPAADSAAGHHARVAAALFTGHGQPGWHDGAGTAGTLHQRQTRELALLATGRALGAGDVADTSRLACFRPAAVLKASASAVRAPLAGAPAPGAPLSAAARSLLARGPGAVLNGYEGGGGLAAQLRAEHSALCSAARSPGGRTRSSPPRASPSSSVWSPAGVGGGGGVAAGFPGVSDSPFPGPSPGVTPTAPTGKGLLTRALDCDVVVAGVGCSGIGAALTAARSGATVVAIHGRPVVGGNASSEVRLHIVGANVSGGRGVALETEAREGGVCEETRLDQSVANPQWCPEMEDLIFLGKFRELDTMTLLLNCWFDGADVDPTSKAVTTVYATNQITQERFVIACKVLIDTTGDGRAIVEAGAAWTQGREAASLFDEDLAPATADTLTEGTSLAFNGVDMGKPTPFRLPPSFTRRFVASDFEHRAVDRMDYGYWWIELSYPYDTVSDGEAIRRELTECLMGVWDYIKNSGNGPSGNETWALNWFGWYPCKREARRLRGQYVQHQADIQTPTAFPDAVAFGGWPLDLHNPRGINDPSQPPNMDGAVPYLYGTPLRSLTAGAACPNLLAAGRLSSLTHVAYGSQRVMATGMVMGQAAGAAAAYCAAHGVQPADATADPGAVWSIQQQLLREDCYIVAQYNADPRDKARTAEISADTEAANGAAANVVSGQSRATDGKGGTAPGQTIPGTNRWISSALPATLTLSWTAAEAFSVGQVQLVFDTGLYRNLTFSIRREDQEAQVWGVPQPETVTAYSVQVLPAATFLAARGSAGPSPGASVGSAGPSPGACVGAAPAGERTARVAERIATHSAVVAGFDSAAWVTVAEVDSNHQRRVVHSVPEGAVPGGAVVGLRVVCSAAAAITSARICEVRVYPAGQTGPWPAKSEAVAFERRRIAQILGPAAASLPSASSASSPRELALRPGINCTASELLQVQLAALSLAEMDSESAAGLEAARAPLPPPVRAALGLTDKDSATLSAVLGESMSADGTGRLDGTSDTPKVSLTAAERRLLLAFVATKPRIAEAVATSAGGHQSWAGPGRLPAAWARSAPSPSGAAPTLELALPEPLAMFTSGEWQHLIRS